MTKPIEQIRALRPGDQDAIAVSAHIPRELHSRLVMVKLERRRQGIDVTIPDLIFEALAKQFPIP